MDTYSLLVYALFFTAFILTMISFLRTFRIYTIPPIIKGIVGISTFTLSLIPFKTYSLAMLVYGIFDTPSFLLAFVSILSILRSFINQIGMLISFKGIIFLLCAWILFFCNTLNLVEWSFGLISYKILVVSVFIALAYCCDRICAILMLLSFLLWIPFSHTIDIYYAVFDGFVCVGCIFIQSLPVHHDNFHIAVLKPKS